MGSVGCLAKGDIFFWQNILKNRSKYTGDISEQSIVCTVLISAIIIEIFRKNIPISYIIPHKNLASPLILVCLKKSHMSNFERRVVQFTASWFFCFISLQCIHADRALHFSISWFWRHLSCESYEKSYSKSLMFSNNKAVEPVKFCERNRE